MADWLDVSKMKKVIRARIKHYKEVEQTNKKYHIRLQARGRRMGMQSLLTWVQDQLSLSEWNRRK